MGTSWKFSKSKIIRKVNWSKIVKYSIKQHNPSIIASQLQGRPSKLSDTFTIDFVHCNVRGSNELLIHRVALHSTDSIKSIVLDTDLIESVQQIAARRIKSSHTHSIKTALYLVCMNIVPYNIASKSNGYHQVTMHGLFL